MPSSRDTARLQLERLLHILPAAARKGGVTYDELSRTLGVDAARVRKDVTELQSRSFHHPPGSGDQLQVTLEEDRVRVWTTGEFTRPVRLTPREILALHLGLRMMAGQESPELRGRAPELARRLAEALAALPAEELETLLASRPVATDVEQGPDQVQATVFAAARHLVHCALRYLKPDGAAPEERRVCPYALVRAEGRWYVVGHACDADEVRVFRMDRVLAAELDGEPFEVPEEFDVSDYVDGGRVYRAHDEDEVRVRYSPRIARWIRERELESGPGAETEAGAIREASDGSVLVDRRVADPRWLVRHVLQYGPDAEVVEPEAYRGMVREVVEGMAG